VKDAVANILDPDDFVIVPHVCVLDTFRMTNDDGTFVADITEGFIDKTIDHMNGRERLTGDLAPFIIGHTPPEGDQDPSTTDENKYPVVGYARNWHKDILGTTGKPAAFIDAWIFKEDAPRVKKFPRRSCEVWTGRYECDPISLLGGTTPARDLGLMKLNRTGSLTYISPGEMIMPEDKKNDKNDKDSKPKADPKETGAAKTEDGKLDQIIAALQSLTDMLGKTLGGAPGAGPDMSGAAPGGAAAGGDTGAMSDAELEQLLSGMGGEGGGAGGDAGANPDQSRKGQEPVKNAAGAPGGDNTYVPSGDAEVHKRLSRVEAENQELRVQLARGQVQDALKKIHGTDQKDINPEDESLIADLVAMPPDMRTRQIENIRQFSRPRLNATTPLLSNALNDARPVNPHAVGRQMTPEDQNRLIKLARSKNKLFEQIAAEEGFAVPGVV
jgi:hypothetical protein